MSRASRSASPSSGYALVVWRSFWRAPALILTVTTLSMFFLYKMRIWPEQFWMTRRFLTEILPGTFIFVAAALFAPVWMMRHNVGLTREGGRDPLSRSIGVLGAVLLGRHYLVRVGADSHARRVRGA